MDVSIILTMLLVYLKKNHNKDVGVLMILFKKHNENYRGMKLLIDMMSRFKGTIWSKIWKMKGKTA